MRSLLFFLFLFIFKSLYSQNNTIDSLKNRLVNSSISNEERLSTLALLSDKLIRKSKNKESLKFFMNYYNLSKKLDDYKNLAVSTRYISDTYLFLNDSTNSYEFAVEGVKVSEENDNLESYLLSINQLGRAYDSFGNQKGAIHTYNKGLKKFEENGGNQKLKVITQLHINLANSYYEINEEVKANATLLKGVEYSEKVKDPTGVSYGLYFLGWKYMELENYEKAENYFLKSLNYADSVALPAYINMNHHALGINYSRAGEYKKAIYHDSVAIVKYRAENNQLYLFDALNNMAVALIGIGNYKDAQTKAEEALIVIKPYNNKLYENGVKQTLIKTYIENTNYDKAEKYLLEILKDSLNPKFLDLETKTSSIGQLAIVFEKQGELKKALKYQKQFKILADSIDAEKRESNFADIETKYQTEKKEKENIQLKAENAEQALLTQKANTQKWLFAISAIAIGLIAFLLWRRYKSEVRSKRTIQEQKETIEILQKDLHHRVKNNLSVIDAFIEELKNDITDVGLSTKLSELQNRVLSINEVHAQLYKNTDITNIDVKKYVNSIAMNVASTFDRPEIKVQEKISDNLKLNPSKSSLMGLIINEFITNSFKYAFDKEGEIVIQIDDKDNEIDMTLSDNGKGLPEDFDLKKVTSYGFRIMKLLTLQLEGTFNFNSDNGLKLHIEFPKT